MPELLEGKAGRARGIMDEARKMQEECLRIRGELLGKKHSDYINTMVSLASNLSWMGRFDESYKLEKECLEIVRETWGEMHP